MHKDTGRTRKIGDWTATENQVTEVERKGAGARGYVSRTYHNEGKDKDPTRHASPATHDVCRRPNPQGHPTS